MEKKVVDLSFLRVQESPAVKCEYERRGISVRLNLVRLLTLLPPFVQVLFLLLIVLSMKMVSKTRIISWVAFTTSLMRLMPSELLRSTVRKLTFQGNAAAATAAKLNSQPFRAARPELAGSPQYYLIVYCGLASALFSSTCEATFLKNFNNMSKKHWFYDSGFLSFYEWPDLFFPEYC